MKEDSFLSQNQIIAELCRSPHGSLEEYKPLGLRAAREEPEFLAHLIAWNARKGKILDSKKALPVLALTAPDLDSEFADNAYAHLAMLNPREFLGSYRFALQVRPQGHMTALRRLIARYVADLESDRDAWNRAAVQHRDTLAGLYTLGHLPRSVPTGAVLFGGEGSRRRNREVLPGVLPRGSVFETLSNLGGMDGVSAAAAIRSRKLPFRVAFGALRGEARKHPDVLLALIERASPNELTTNMKALENLGVRSTSALQAALEAALGRLSKSGTNILKTSQAAAVVQDEGLREKLLGVQERQIQASGGVDGNWLVLGDASPSMAACIDMARFVAGGLAKLVKGKVTLVFFHGSPRIMDVTGLDYEAVIAKTKQIQAGGSGTSIGCGVLAALQAKAPIDGIAIASDAQENTPPIFVDQYKALCQALGKEVPVYLYRMGTKLAKKASWRVPQWGSGDYDLAWSMTEAGFAMEEFDLTSGKVDYYSIMNLISSMRTNRYSLGQEILDTPLKTLDSVLAPMPARERVLAHA